MKRMVCKFEGRKCGKCGQALKKGDDILFSPISHTAETLICHYECPPGAEMRKAWRRPNPPDATPRMQVVCEICSKHYAVKLADRAPLKCDFCGTLGSVEIVLRRRDG